MKGREINGFKIIGEVKEGSQIVRMNGRIFLLEPNEKVREIIDGKIIDLPDHCNPYNNNSFE